MTALFKSIREITVQNEDFGYRVRQYSNDFDLVRRPSAETPGSRSFLLNELDEVRGDVGYSGRGPTNDGGIPGVFAQQLNVQTTPVVDDDKGSAPVKDRSKRPRLDCVTFSGERKVRKGQLPIPSCRCEEESLSII